MISNGVHNTLYNVQCNLQMKLESPLSVATVSYILYEEHKRLNDLLCSLINTFNFKYSRLAHIKSNKF